MEKKDLINKLRLINVFMTALINGILGGIWNRYYNENLPYFYMQLQMFIIFAVEILVSHFCEKLKNRQLIFNIHLILTIASIVLDLSSIILFQITNNPYLLLIGDTIIFIVFTIDDVAFVEIDSALLHGNERSTFSHKRGKIRSFGSLISYSISLILGIFVIKNMNISSTLLTITQYVNWGMSLILLIPLCYIYHYSKPIVYIMWVEQK